MTSFKKVSNLSLVKGVWKHHRSLVDYMESLRSENGETFSFSFGSMNGFFINDPVIAKTIMMDKWAAFPKSRRYKTLAPLIGDSILTSNGNHWKERRVLAQPIFQARIMAGYQDVIEKEVMLSIAKLKDGDTFEAYTHVAHFTFRVITKIMFSDDIDDVFDKFHETILRIQNECTQVALYPFAFMDHLPLPANIKFRKLSGIIHEIVDNIIEKRLRNPKAHEYKDLLSRYLDIIKKENQNISMTELRNELVTLLIAGNETTALSISWALLELGKNKTIQDKLITEMKELKLPEGGENTFQFFRQVPYLTKVVNETFRMYPAVWLFTREALQDEEVHGIKIKKDSLILISPYFMHRNEMYWQRPEEFNPERWNEAHHEDAYIPFAKGPRMCLGMSLSQFEISLYLYHFFKNFTITPAGELNKVKPKPLVNLYPNLPIQLKAQANEAI